MLAMSPLCNIYRTVISHINSSNSIVLSSYMLLPVSSTKFYTVVKFQIPNPNIFQDMNLCLVWILVNSRQTDGKWYIWAHRASCTGRLKNGAVSSLAGHFILPGRTWLVMTQFARNEKWCLSWLNPKKDIILWKRWRHWFMLINGPIFFLLLQYPTRHQNFCS